MFVYIYMRLGMCVRACMHVRTRVHADACARARMHMHVHGRMHV